MERWKKIKPSEKIKIIAVILFYVILIFGIVYWLKSTEQQQYEKVLTKGLTASATITDKYELPYRNGTSYMFDITYTANKSVYEMDTIKIGEDFNVSWLSSSFDFEFIHTKIKVNEIIYNQCNIADGIEIIYLLSDPEKGIILHPENKQLYARNK